MILNKNNELNDKLVDDIFDVVQDSVRFYDVKYFGADRDSLDGVVQQVIYTLALEDVALEADEIELLNQQLIAATKVSKYCCAGGFWIVSNGKIVQLATGRDSEVEYSVDIVVETLFNSDYYLSHQEDFDRIWRLSYDGGVDRRAALQG